MVKAYLSEEDDQRAVSALLEAVSFVTTALRARTRRDALLVMSTPRLASVTARVVSAFGFRVYRVDSGPEAAATAAARRFDLIIFEADPDAAPETARWVSRVRALPDEFGDGPILVVGAEAPLREALGDAGVDGFVTEPVTASKLIDLLALLLGARAESAP